MLTINDVKFGRIEPSVEKVTLHASIWGFSTLLEIHELPLVKQSFDKRIPLDKQFIEWYNQGSMSACVGASSAKLMATLNLPQIGAQQYDWREHYRWACKNDNDPQTSYKADVGTYVWAGMDCLRKMGAYSVASGGFQLSHGIASYYWCSGSDVVDQMRTAIYYDRPLLFGVPWYEGWMDKIYQQPDGTWWLPKRSKWGKVVGGHAIMAPDALDTLNAYAWANTWGAGYPERVHVPYEDAEYLMLQAGGECAVGIDQEWTPEPEPEPESESIPFEISVEGEGTFTGTVVKAVA